MKRFFFASLLLLSLSSFAQEQTKTGKPSSLRIQVYNGYLIKLNSIAEGGYGYDILYQGKLVVSQKINPFTLSPKGLSTQEDAFKIARWQVQQLQAGAMPEMISGQTLPRAIAKQLDIVLN